jgi:hypothetical protein
MPFHIRLVSRTEPKITSTLVGRAPKTAVFVEFFQGIAFGLGVALIMIGALWLMHTNGMGL